MASFLPSPGTVVELSRFALGQVMESAAAAATVPVRVLALLSQAELAASRINLVAERAEALIERVGAVVDDAEDTVRRTRAVVTAATLAVDEAAKVAASAVDVVDSAGAVAGRAARAVEEVAVVSASAGDVVRRASTTAATADELLDGYAPTLRRAAPLAARFIEELTAEEVQAAIRMIDELPRLRHHLANDVLPLLGKMDQVGPDMHSLLEVTRDLHLAIAGIPGLKMLRRRGEQKLDDEDAVGAE